MMGDPLFKPVTDSEVIKLPNAAQLHKFGPDSASGHHRCSTFPQVQ